MNSDNNTPNKPEEILLKYLDERIDSCQEKRVCNKKRMNLLKVLRIIFSVLSTFMVALLGFEIIEGIFKIMLNIAALIFTLLVTLSSTFLIDFGFENRFKQNVQSLGKLKSLKSKFELEMSFPEIKSEIDYTEWHNKITKVLDDQSVKFDEEFKKAIKQK